MKNDALKHQGRYQGVYERAEIVNGKPSWNNSVNAIWYNPEGNRWVVGNLTDIGAIHIQWDDTMMHNLYAENNINADYYWKKNGIAKVIELIGGWKYWSGSKWNSPIDSKDLIVSCKGTYSVG